MDMQVTDGGATPGTMLGSYRIERLLGRGGFGAVFLAYDTRLRRQVALKVIERGADTDASRARVLREARNAAALNHPNVCTIYEVGEPAGGPFIAMEYVEGCSLRDRLDGGALPLDEVLRYGQQAADALSYAHDHGVVHRDFKAANAIVSTAGGLKIVDFGLAYRDDALIANVTTVASVAPVATAAGTPYAMAPEQVRMDATDARTDIWALGVLLYEMAAGRAPFEAPTVAELFSSVLRDRPADLPSRVPIELRAVIERCLEKDPGRRYQIAAEVRAALEAIQAGTAPALGALRYQLRKRASLVSAAMLLLVAAAAAIVGLNVGHLRDRLAGRAGAAPMKLAVLPLENLTGDPTQEYFSDGLTEEMISQIGRLQPQRLIVVARTSSMRYKNGDVPISQIGRELGVDYLVEGSVRREGNRIRVDATLVRVRDQAQQWSDSYERELASILAIESDVARGVARSLAVTLLPADEARLRQTKTVDPAAYEAYLNGRSHATTMTRASLDLAEQYFQTALAKDPAYAPAYAGLSQVWSLRQQMQFVPPKEAAPRMKEMTQRALALDDSLPEIHERLAIQHFASDWDWPAADAEFQRTIELGPTLAQARATYSHYLYALKRPLEGRAQIQRAIELDPLNEGVRAFYAVTLRFEHRYADAETELRRQLKINPGSQMAWNGLAELCYSTRRYEEGLNAERERWVARGDTDVVAALTQGFEGGDFAVAMRRGADTLAAMVTSGGALTIPVAGLYVRAGAIDRALDWLEKAYDAHDPNIAYIGVAPLWDALRGQPRFQELLRRLKLPG